MSAAPADPDLLGFGGIDVPSKQRGPKRLDLSHECWSTFYHLGVLYAKNLETLATYDQIAAEVGKEFKTTLSKQNAYVETTVALGKLIFKVRQLLQLSSPEPPRISAYRRAAARKSEKQEAVRRSRPRTMRPRSATVLRRSNGLVWGREDLPLDLSEAANYLQQA